MRVNLSKFLQSRYNVFIYNTLGWRISLFYIVMLGKLYFFFNRGEKQKIENAVESVFKTDKSEKQIESIKSRVLTGIICHYYEKLFNAYENFERLNKFFKKNIYSDSLEKLENALAHGKGVLFVTGHYGAIEYIPIFLALNKYPVSAVAKFKTPKLKEILYQKTKPLGLNIIDPSDGKGTLTAIMKELKKNRIVFIECDEIEEWKPAKKEYFMFLGERVGLDRTLNIIQRRTGAKIIFGIMHRFNLEKYHLIIKNYKDILAAYPSNEPKCIGEKVLKFFEQYIYSYPEEWYQWKNFAEVKRVSISKVVKPKQRAKLLFRPEYCNA